MKQRILTGIIGGILFLALVWAGEIWYSLLIFLLGTVALYEYLRMKGIRWFLPEGVLGYLFLFSILSFGMMQELAPDFPYLWLFFFLFAFLPVATRNRVTIFEVSYIFLGCIYIGLGFHFMHLTRFLAPDGLEWTLLVIACVWATDTGAYFSGRFFGRRKLWPEISPKKTVEGAFGGLLLSVLIALIFQGIVGMFSGAVSAAVFGLVLSVAAQIGDLIESALKRTLGVKDSGQILPGHGGMLDRFDSMIIVFPVAYLYLQLFV